MSSPVISFPAADRQQWQDLVIEALHGASLGSLDRIDEDGLEIAALYQITSSKQVSNAQVPIHRLTTNPAQRLAYGWRICQPVDGNNAPEVVNRAILNELAGGAAGVYLELGPVSAKNLEQILYNVFLGAADIVLDAGQHADDLAATFESLARGHNKTLSDMSLDLAIDPYAPGSDSDVLTKGLQWLGCADFTNIPTGIFRLNGWQWHNHGLSQVQELAYLLAAATQIFRSGTEAGLSTAQIARKTSMSIALPADMFDGIAKCRALRRCWAVVVKTLGLKAETYPLQLHALPSMRMFSLVDVETNILRTTTALLGGAIGGADMMTAFAHDALSGGSAMGRRLARMQQVMMIEESGLGRSLDAAGGSAFIEARTDALAAAAWAGFQDIEAAGGAAVAHADGTFALMAQEAAMRRNHQLAQDALPLLGVTFQSESQPVGNLLPRWQTVSRPAAVIEKIRRQTMITPPRILLLQQGDKVESRLEKIRGLLSIGGMSAVHITLPLASANTVQLARANIVVLLNLKIEELDPLIYRQLDNSILPGGIFEADKILQQGSQIHWLLKLADMIKDVN